MAATDNASRRGPLRLFFALWPDAAVRAALATLTAQLQAHCGGRPTATPNLHATLAFLGAVQRERLGEFEAIAMRLHAEPFELILDTVGYWRHNRIVWAGSSVMPDPLASLAAGLKRELEGLSWPVDERSYTPHVTLIRDARKGPVEGSADVPRWLVSEFVLVSSTHERGALRYTPLARFPLSR